MAAVVESTQESASFRERASEIRDSGRGALGILKAVLVLLLIGAGGGAWVMYSAPPEKTAAPDEKFETVKIKDKVFKLELALDDEHRFHGLSGRTEIKPDGGMLFVMPYPSKEGFVMRDCPIPIDIIYLDGSGRVTAVHKMKSEPPRTEAEKKLSPPFKAAPEWAWTNDAYESRLKQYSSRFAAQFVIELKGDTLDELKLKEGDQVALDTSALKKRAK